MKNKVTVAGYLCLDIMPRICAAPDGEAFSFVPGKLQEIKGTDMACGGAVANTGLALHILGKQVLMAARLGDDIVGMTIRGIIDQYAPALTAGIINDENASSGCTVVLNPPQQDRMFLVNTGANRLFTPEDVSDAMLSQSALLHFGYPPLMENFYRHNGEAALRLFRRAHAAGAMVSLDMSLPDSASDSARVDWEKWLTAVLPEVDVFLPSLEEIRFMLQGSFTGDHAAAGALDANELHRLSERLLQMGVPVVVIKLGSKGIYVRTAADPAMFGRIAATVRSEHLSSWYDRELLSPCLEAEVRGTTGAGDCTIAGFLTGLLEGMSAPATATLACAVGACNVEQPDAVSGLISLDATRRRLSAGWCACDAYVNKNDWLQLPEGVYERRG